MSWKHLLGHETVAASFAAALKRGRLGHAYLFVGPGGIGKQTFARELAKMLLCSERGERFEACDSCSSCKLVDAGTHPDLFMVRRPDDSLEFKIHVIREELLPNLAMKPARGSRKIAIVDDADDLNDEAANCMLKTLEEPPPGSVLILVGGPNAERQLPTILSRCQTIRFAPLPPALVTRILTEHGISDPVSQQRLVQLGGGSPGQALALNDEEVWEFRRQLLDVLRQERIDPAATAAAWMAFILNAGAEASVQRPRASLVFRMLLVLLETALKLTLGAAIAGIDSAEEQVLRKFGEALGEERLLGWIERALEADLHIDRRVQVILALEAFLDAVCRDR
jgi:DNA polymerase III subunit delta'